jgi:hypothetical protein
MSNNERKCPHCHSVLEEDAIFCVECGNTTEIPEAKEEETVVIPLVNQTPIENQTPKTEEANPNIQPIPLQTENIQKEIVTQIIEKPSNVQSNNSMVINSLTSRYQDGYRLANTINGFGTLLKVVGGVLGGGIISIGFIIGVIASDKMGREGGIAFIGILLLYGIIGAIVGLIFWVLGVIISAQGQMLKANFDSAVNSSPFLANEDRIKIMNL